jgi:membrane protein required for colicin V production
VLTGFDIAILAFVALSGLFALVRGLTREVLAIIAWAGAAYVAYRLYPYVLPFAQRHIESEWVAEIAAGAGLFILALIVLSVLSHGLAQRVRSSPANGLDRLLGLVFGLARGMLVVCLLYAVADRTVFHQSRPDWIQRARVTPALQRGADYLVSLIPKDRLHRLEPNGPGRPKLPLPVPTPAPDMVPPGPTQKAAHAASAEPTIPDSRLAIRTVPHYVIEHLARISSAEDT